MAATDRDLKAAIAVTRFGLGARPGELAEAQRDPVGFLRDQIGGAAEPLATGGETSAQRIAAFREYQQDVQARRRMGAAETPEAPVPPERDPVRIAQRMLREDTGGDFLSRAQIASTTTAAFRERWALFWANHFTVSAVKLQSATVVGPFENEALRPNVFGRFEDLLGAVETHPAMLIYLDQVQSIGPNSPAARALGQRARRQNAPLPGLNENLAREILELHTVGVDGGYAQADVTEFARAMTGVSIGGLRDADDLVGKPIFREAAHEPGARTVMGTAYPAGGKEQAGAILSDLARKPQTARFVCRKIARHFVADDPPPALVARLEGAWTSSGGRLDAVATALITAPEAWEPRPRKFKTPYEFIVSGFRAAGGQPRRLQDIQPILTAMGQAPFRAPSPEGWPDDEGSWAAPDAIIKRMTWAQGFAAAATRDRDPSRLAAEALGARLAPATATAIARAETRPEGFALLLMSPEFLRR